MQTGNSEANGLTEPTDWNVINWKYANQSVRNLRQRIFRATTEGNWRKVQSLQKLMLRSYSNALISVRRVTQINAGKHTPGGDKVVVKTPAERGKLVDELMTNQPWRAKPAKRVYIPKANGKLRPLGIPIIKDRAFQAMVKNALEPQWETIFEASSYGFRPGRSQHDAIGKIYNLAQPNKRKKWVLDCDIKGAFDNISHEYLLKTIGAVPGKELIKQWLKAGYVEHDQYHDTESGTPQGGVISPLLANIALHGMEKALGVKHNAKGELISKRAVVRFADDFVVFCETKEDTEQVKAILTQWLQIRGLQFSDEKTHTVHLSEGFDFLGYNVRQYPVTTTKTGWKLLIKPSKKSVQKLRDRLREEWQSLTGHSVEDVIIKLNPIIRGWANYHRNVVASKTFSTLDHYMFIKECRYAQRTHPGKSKHWRQNKYFGNLHASREDRWVFGNKKTGSYLQKFAWFNIQRHILVVGTASPDDPTLREYWEKRKRLGIKTLSLSNQKLAKNQRGKCPLCGETLFNDELLEVHHIEPQKKGGKHTYTNLLLVHYYCHQQLTADQRKARQL